MKKAPCKVSISTFRGPGPDRHVIIVEDESSGCRIAEVELTPENLIGALTGRGMVPAEATYYGLNRVGAVREVKTENVKWVQPRNANKPEEIERLKEWAIRPHELDGWKGRLSDLGNPHHRNPDGTYSVTFVRFVTPK